MNIVDSIVHCLTFCQNLNDESDGTIFPEYSEQDFDDMIKYVEDNMKE